MFPMWGGGGTPHIPSELIWSDIQGRVGKKVGGTPHTPTAHLLFKVEKGGTPHNPYDNDLSVLRVGGLSGKQSVGDTAHKLAHNSK